MHEYMRRRDIHITGSDAKGFLQNLITQDITKAEKGLIYGALLTPQGKFIADFLIRQIKGGYALDVDETAAQSLVKRLGMFKLRSEVTITEAPGAVFCGQGEPPENAQIDPRHPRMGWRLYGHSSGDEGQDWDALRIACGVPQFGRELTSESYILEMGFERLFGVDFQKGCYVGQEVTARMHHKTTLQKGLVRITGAEPLTRGARLVAEGKDVGEVFSVSQTQALAYLNLRRSADHPLTAEADQVIIAIEKVEQLF